MDLLKIHEQSVAADFRAKLDVAAVVVGIPNPRVWAADNAIAVALEFAKTRATNDDAFVEAVRVVFAGADSEVPA